MENKREEYLKHIRFKSVATDREAVYEKIWQRIRYGKEIAAGVSAKWKYYSVAATLAFLAVSVCFFYTTRQSEGAVAYMEVVAVAGSKAKVVLPDSSVVWLNSNARIRYPQQFTGECRRVNFDGEALFQVAQDKKRPFIVDMESLKIKVLGTVFYVSACPDSEVIQTTLLKGSVGLYSADNLTATADLVLQPDEQAEYTKKNGSIEVQKVHGRLYTAWIKGEFYFENNTLQEIMAALERAFNVPIHVVGEEWRNKAFTAQFTHGESLDQILSILQVSAKYTYRKQKGEIYITSK